MRDLLGIWKLVGRRALDEAGRDTPSPFGPTPMGLVLFERERMMGRDAASSPTPGRIGSTGKR